MCVSISNEKRFDLRTHHVRRIEMKSASPVASFRFLRVKGRRRARVINIFYFLSSATVEWRNLNKSRGGNSVGK